MWGLIVVSILGFVAWEVSGVQRGQLVANVELAFGRHKFLSYGHEYPWTTEYRMVLEQRFGIETETVESSFFADGYNSVSLEEAFNKFGESELNQVAREVRNRWKSEKR